MAPLGTSDFNRICNPRGSLVCALSSERLHRGWRLRIQATGSPFKSNVTSKNPSGVVLLSNRFFIFMSLCVCLSVFFFPSFSFLNFLILNLVFRRMSLAQLLCCIMCVNFVKHCSVVAVLILLKLPLKLYVLI